MRLRSVFLLVLLISSGAIADDSPLSLADLEAYRLALGSKLDQSSPTVRFRDLWDHPEAYTGRRVQVEGRVARLFRQPRVGEFPPLIEAWVISPAGDPFCLVFAQIPGGPTPELGASVRFAGTFLRKIQYHGTDTARLAPLIVGPGPPSNLTGPSVPSGRSWASIDWLMGLGAAAIVGMILMSRHFSRPVSPPRSLEPPPVFLDGKPDWNQEEWGPHEEV